MKKEEKETRETERLVKFTYFGIKSKVYLEILTELEGRKLVDDNEGTEEYWLDASIHVVNILKKLNILDEKLAQVLIKNIKNKNLDYIVVYL